MCIACSSLLHLQLLSFYGDLKDQQHFLSFKANLKFMTTIKLFYIFQFKYATDSAEQKHEVQVSD